MLQRKHGSSIQRYRGGTRVRARRSRVGLSRAQPERTFGQRQVLWKCNGYVGYALDCNRDRKIPDDQLRPWSGDDEEWFGGLPGFEVLDLKNEDQVHDSLLFVSTRHGA